MFEDRTTLGLYFKPDRDFDVNGRPCCKRHLGKQDTVAWRGDAGEYPHGTGGCWSWAHGGGN